MKESFISCFICASVLLAQGTEPTELVATDRVASTVAPSEPATSAASSQPVAAHNPATPTPVGLGISFVDGSTSTVVVEREGKKYLVDLAARTIREASANPGPAPMPSHQNTGTLTLVADQPAGAAIFKKNCSMCHGADGKGIVGLKTPDFTSASWQAGITDEKILETIRGGKKGTMMPAWGGKLSEQEILDVRSFVRSFGPGKQEQKMAEGAAGKTEQPKIYEPGDDLLVSLPTGRRPDRHGFYVNFTHRFAFDPAFSGTARGGAFLGLDGISVSSFGFRYGVTDKLSVSIYRSPTFISRIIQLMTAYNFLDEHDGQPLNAAVRFSIEGQNNFRKNYTENFEGVFSRSLGHRAQIYAVPTVSLNARRLFSAFGYESSDIPDLPGVNIFSLGVGGALDIRPTVALVAEVIPTLANGNSRNPATDLGIHRPAYAFGIQKKIWRHSFMFGFTNSPGTTVAERAGTRAAYLEDPRADKPSGLVIGFDLSRQIY